MKLSCIVLFTVTVLIVAGCMTVKPDKIVLMSEGRTRNVPLLIYGTSWDDPDYLYNTRMTVNLLITGRESIKSVTLLTSNCGAKGVSDANAPLVLTGPFVYGKTYSAHPSWAPQYSQWISSAQAKEFAKSSSHIVITSVMILEGGGKKVTYKEDVSKLLTSNISNFCRNYIYIPYLK